jgi:hypothetical protein
LLITGVAQKGRKNEKETKKRRKEGNWAHHSSSLSTVHPYSNLTFLSV